ncbi:Holliday junction resolvase RuvX [Teredinibacter sp. KSP-S5-2]|uniref:Holliday junction resolvase RuvX n=1 Tax=Teredinibacter sp. KSP-S5-2 TaxID=3034506 RepID=UPI0029343035|nr:Holliday junction resolvase RuvX [Teredinibacter sp. KSP-S5-2]WNO09352.1 Holliday junction resolvase RuvX [Teredinibacter sp. KSP-S5-2]
MPPPNITNVLAFDFGTKSIGVAVGQSLTGSGGELPPLKAVDGIPDWQEIYSLILEWQPDLVVVGLPVNMDGTEMEMTRRARKFGNRIHGRYGVPMEFFDERLTTREAKEEAFQRGQTSSNYARNPVDSIAARLILESWFRSQPQ